MEAENDVPRNPNKKRCSGTSKQSGQRCKNNASPGKDVCHIHGGKSTGAPPEKLQGNDNAVTHGIYNSGFTDDELKSLDEIQQMRGSLDAEADLSRITTNRILNHLNAKGTKDGLAVVEVRQEDVQLGAKKESGEGGDQDAKEENENTQPATIIRKRPEFYGLLDRSLGRTVNIEKLRAELEVLELEEKAKILDEMIKRMGRVSGDAKLD